MIKKITIILFVVFIPFGKSIFSQNISNREYYKNFISALKPTNNKEDLYSSRLTYEKIQKILLNYDILEDFSTPDTWDIISPSEHFKDTNTNTAPVTTKELLLWKTIKNTDRDYITIPSNNIAESVNILGARSLFLYDSHVKITLFPKSPLFIPNYDTKYIEIWLFAIEQDYKIFLNIQSYTGEIFKIYMGDTTHYGWKRFLIPIPYKSKVTSINPSHIYTKAFETRSKILSLTFESKDHKTQGFFGIWLASITALYDAPSILKEKSTNPQLNLSQSFDW